MELIGIQVGITDIIDIIVVAAIIYRVLQMMRGTRAAQILLGLFVIFVAYLMSQFFELAALNWLMTHFVDNLFLILVVLFQNEIRRALARVGRAPLFGGPTSEEVTKQVEELVRACARMADRHCGALIVIARQTQLGHYTEHGTMLDAVLSQQLLETIFFPHTPLHDGAAIVDGGRIVAAGCVLPLSQEQELPRDFGTRHRAALGVAMDTDAVVLVVSEESGAISMALEGELVFDLKPEELRSRLQNLLAPGYRKAA
ncbi:MAG: TIGR00159 family protein [Candidatus Dadabacteria bacterium]|nr:MAG: TIGR00159 family protein [Candidatus Dadabacteria bacterium]